MFDLLLGLILTALLLRAAAHLPERAYDNPKFVEDLVRDIALRLRGDRRIAEWTVASENFESIHNHSAYALIEGRNV